MPPSGYYYKSTCCPHTYIYNDWEFSHSTQNVVPYTCKKNNRTVGGKHYFKDKNAKRSNWFSEGTWAFRWDTDLLVGVTGWVLKRNRTNCKANQSCISVEFHEYAVLKNIIGQCFMLTLYRFMVELSVHHDSLPMSLARTATGLRSSVTNFLASSLISMTLLSRAKRGASGNEATNRDTNPNWMTGKKINKQQKNHKNVQLALAVKCNLGGVVFTLS